MSATETTPPPAAGSSRTSTRTSARASALADQRGRAVLDEWEREGIVPREVFAAAGANGFMGMEVPEEYGGGGVDDFRFNVVLGEECSACGSAASASASTLHNDICLPYFLEYCNDEQKQRWLPGIADGELITAIAMTEPGTGSDLAGIKTSQSATATTTSSTAPRPSSPTASTPISWSPRSRPTRPSATRASAARRRARHGGLRARPQPREGRHARPGHRRAVLRRRARARSRTCWATRARASPSWSRTSPRSASRRGRAVAAAQAALAHDAGVRQGAQGLRPADRQLPELALRARGLPTEVDVAQLHRRVRPSARRGQADRRARRRGQVVGAPSCRAA